MVKAQDVIEIPEPKITKFLFADTRLSFIWFVIRLYVGWQWLIAGWEKVTNPLWVGPNAGGALKGFLMGALSKTGGAHPDVQNWYAQFLQNFVMHNLTLFSHLVAFGEVFVGIALLVGLFTGIAAFFGAFMNMNYLLAGTVSINPVLFLFELLLILAWRVGGWWGLDRYALPLFGTPWKPGKIFKK